MLDSQLLNVLVCPICQGALLYDRVQDELVCRIDRLAYPVRDGIPVMLPDQAREITRISHKLATEDEKKR